MGDAIELLRSTPTVTRSVLTHRFLEKILTVPESTAAAWFDEKPARSVEMTNLKGEFEVCFLDGYDPAAYVHGLHTLQDIGEELRARICDVLDHEYAKRFRPHERLARYQTVSREFGEAFEMWRLEITAHGPGSRSGPLWQSLRDRTRVLHGLLGDPQLRCRWIP